MRFPAYFALNMTLGAAITRPRTSDTHPRGEGGDPTKRESRVRGFFKAANRVNRQQETTIGVLFRSFRGCSKGSHKLSLDRQEPLPFNR